MTETPTTHHQVLVIGEATAVSRWPPGCSAPASKDIAIVEPREQHVYKPLFSHVAGGTARASITVRRQGDVIPKGVRWIQDAVASISPDSSTVTLESGAQITYDQVVVCPGIQLDWARVPGLAEALQTPTAASHYEYDLAAKASRLLRDVTAEPSCSPSRRNPHRAPVLRRSRCIRPATTGGPRACSTTSAW